MGPSLAGSLIDVWPSADLLIPLYVDLFRIVSLHICPCGECSGGKLSGKGWIIHLKSQRSCNLYTSGMFTLDGRL